MCFSCYSNLPSSFFEIEEEACRLLGIEPISEDAIWEFARHLEEIPHFGNLRAGLFFPVLKDKLLELEPTLDINYMINVLDTHFNVNLGEVTDAKDLREIIEATKRK